MVTAYEAVFIVDTNLPDEQMNAVISKYTGIITSNGGTVNDLDRWEPRRLAYEIKGRREGIYIVVNFESEPAAKDELDRIFRISDDVIRYIVVKQDKKADKYPSRTRAAEQDRREREQAARQVAPSNVSAPPVTELSAPVPVAGVNEGSVSDGDEPSPQNDADGDE